MLQRRAPAEREGRKERVRRHHRGPPRFLRRGAQAGGQGVRAGDQGRVPGAGAEARALSQAGRASRFCARLHEGSRRAPRRGHPGGYLDPQEVQ